MNVTRITALLLVAGSVLSGGCALNQMVRKAKDQSLTITPNPLELHGDSVSFTMDAVLPAGMLRKNKIYTLTPTYTYKDQRLELPPLSFNAKNFPRAKRESPRASRRYAFPYTGSDLDMGVLVVQGMATNINGRGKKTPESEIARGLVTISRTFDVAYAPIMEPSGYTTDEEYTPTTVSFYFEQGSDKLRPSEIRGTRGRFLDNFIAARNVTKTVTITGNHSPEGREAKNVLLSQNRATAIEKYYRAQMKRFKYRANDPAIRFVTKSLIEDWRPFKDSLARYQGISDAQKQQMLAIIDNGQGSFAERQLQLEQLDFYPTVFRELYPRLRVAETEILTILPKKSEAEINQLSREMLEGTRPITALTDRELAYAASVTPGMAERERLYEMSVRKNDLPSSHTNLGAIYLIQAAQATETAQRNNLIERARTHFDIAINRQPTAKPMLNKALAALMLQDFATASQQLTQAERTQLSNEDRAYLNSLRGVVMIRQGNYQAALTALNAGAASPTTSYNRGLAQLLTRDYASAIASFHQATAERPTYPRAYYANAVANHLSNQRQAMGENLSRAIQQDGRLRTRANEDVIFYQARESEEFKNSLR